MTRIAIDGYAAAGKGTLAKDIANKLKYQYLDTGKIYRYAAFQIEKYSNGHIDDMIENIKKDIKILPKIGIFNKIIAESKIFDQNKLNNEYIANIASKISQIENLREILTQHQIRFMQENQNVVADGRDIGTVICPQAEIKIFVTAEISVRAKRRFQQIQNIQNKKMKIKDVQKYIEQIKCQLIKRDAQDTKRKIAPLEKAKNAIEIDTSNINRKQMLDIAIKYINAKKNLKT